MSDVVIPGEVREKVLDGIAAFARDIRGEADPEILFGIISAGGACPITTVFRRFIAGLKRQPDELRYLEIGAGYGFSAITCLKRGFNVVGVEPGDGIGFKGRYHIARELMGANGIKNPDKALVQCSGEDMSCFPGASFDVVYGFAVLEHVKDIGKVLAEADRVLKDGGIMYMNVPNYNSFYEGHYHIFWVPYLLKNKKVAKAYVRLRKRKDYYLDELIFTTPGMIRKIAGQTLTHGDYYIFPHINGAIMGRIAKVFHYLSLDLPCGDFIVNFVRGKSFIKAIALKISRSITMLCIALGFARVFNLIYFKREDN